MVDEERYKLLAWHLVTYSRENGYTLDEFRSAIAFLFGWGCYGESDEFKKGMLVIAEKATDAFFMKGWG